ncbi:hypothetical protein ACWEPN_34410 [Nonomuraea wenchangensis]
MLVAEGQGVQVAEEIDFSKVSKLENNKQPPTETDVREWCRICGAEAQTTDLVASVRNVNAF